jgi:hypothetical protein
MNDEEGQRGCRPKDEDDSSEATDEELQVSNLNVKSQVFI